MTEDKLNPASVSLVSLKCILFLFFGGLGCLVAFLPLHMRSVGLTGNESRIVSIVAPCVAILGPLIVGPLSDRWRTGAVQHSKHMRGLLAGCLLLGAAFYCSLLAVPTVSRLQQRNPAVTFFCDPSSAFVLQEQCQDSPCFEWSENDFGSLFLSHCSYDCNNGMKPNEQNNTNASPEDAEIDNYEDEGSGANDKGLYLSKDDDAMKEPPHLCLTTGAGTVCHVYTAYSEQLTVNVSLKPDPDTFLYDSDWCRFPVRGKVSCHMPSGLEKCVITCDLDDPYTRPNSLLAKAKCQKTIGDDQLTFWSYLTLRSLADIFPTTVLTLLDSCLVTATRDSPGWIGPQLAVAALGIAFFPPVTVYATSLVSEFFLEGILPLYNVSIVVFTALSCVAALIVIFDKSMPLSPVDYWLHSSSGFLILKGGGGETAAVLLVLVLLGTLWSTLDSYLPWHLLLELRGSELLVALTLTAGALPSVPFLWFVEPIVNYCGHSHLFISAFTFYIIRFTGLVFFVNPWWLLLCEALEVFTFGIMWATAVLYMRQLISRHLTTTGQALAVIAHFSIGRSVGALLGGVLSENDSLVLVYKVCAVLAAVVATAYFFIYHCCLRPRCLQSPATGYRNPHATLQGTNVNGTYTPLKVYSQKGDRNSSNSQTGRY